MNILRTASLGSNFTGFYKKRVYLDRNFETSCLHLFSYFRLTTSYYIIFAKTH